MAAGIDRAGSVALAWDRTLHAQVVAVARRIVGDSDEAEDLAQETWIRASAGALRLRSTDRITPWVLRICRHASIDYVRTRRVRRHIWRPLPDDAADRLVERPRQLGDAHVDGVAVDELPAHQRLLVVLHYQRGIGQPVLCRLTGLSPAALRVRLYRARRNLALLSGGPCGAASGTGGH